MAVADLMHGSFGYQSKLFTSTGQQVIRKVLIKI